MPSITESVVGKMNNLPSLTTPRVNVVTFVALLVPIVVGGLLTLLTSNLAGVIVGTLVGVIAAQSPQVAKQ